MYLAGNSHPEIAFAVHQCAHFSHCPKQTHSVAVKHLARYLKGILDSKDGMILKPTTDLSLDCYVDADFAGLWNYEDDQDPICVCSRTGYVMTMGGCPIHWTSKLQGNIILLRTEAEFVALAQAMRELIPMRRSFDDMLVAFNLRQDNSPTVKSIIFEDNNGAISTATTPKMTPCTKHIAVKYHFVKQLFHPSESTKSLFQLVKIDTLSQKADVLTKGLGSKSFHHIRKLLCGY